MRHKEKPPGLLIQRLTFLDANAHDQGRFNEPATTSYLQKYLSCRRT